MNQVLVRQPRLIGDTVLKMAEVVSRTGDVYRIKYPGEFKVEEVHSSRVVQSSIINGGQPRVNSRHATRQIPKQYPDSRSALVNLLN
jgi:hypothetical protein